LDWAARDQTGSVIVKVSRLLLTLSVLAAIAWEPAGGELFYFALRERCVSIST